MSKEKIILTFDTCLTNSIALYWDGEITTADLSSDANLSKPSHILPLIDRTLKNLNLAINQVDALALLTGPGSFTGIRIGIAMAKAFAISAGIELVAVNTFEAIKEKTSPVEGFAIILNAGGGYYYYGDESSLKEDKDLEQIELMKWSAIENNIESRKKIILFGGRLQQIKEKLDKAERDYIELDSPLAESVLSVAIKKLGQDKTVSISDLQPVYIKPSYVDI
jgi:tRNA threonylcarbamoyl adenosine modification protein YeaZ